MGSHLFDKKTGKNRKVTDELKYRQGHIKTSIHIYFCSISVTWRSLGDPWLSAPTSR